MFDIFFIGEKNISDDAWNKIKNRFPYVVRIFLENNNYEKAYKEGAKRSFTNMFWTIDNDVEIIDSWNFDFAPSKWDKDFIHIWPNCKGTINLWPKQLVLRNEISDLLNNSGYIKIIDEKITKSEIYDIFFVSYEEEHSDINWQKLKSRFNNATRIHGIKGIGNAHRECSKRSSTEMFWTIDGDTVVDDIWDFSFRPQIWDKNYIHIWYSRNPINGLEYGYGAVKLWPTKKVKEYDGNWLDFTTSITDMKIISETIATTKFNTSEYSTWKSSFRECIKLMTNISKNENDIESQNRLKIWSNVCNKTEEFSEWSLIGAKDAAKWYNENISEIGKINDFQWLHNKFLLKINDIR